jgi:cytochrome c-type biogenesis protein CcmH/NrfF
MSSTRLDEILLFALPVVVIVIGLLWNIGRSIDRVARNLERLAEAQEQSAARPKE